jgi:DNA polymerase I-like protein with 3'-5' exonuclease and polymerase domains
MWSGSPGELRRLAGRDDFNPRAARQVEAALIARGADLSSIPRTAKADMPMFTADTLPQVDDPLAATLLAYRAEKKMADYAAGLFRHAHGERLYGDFRQVGTATGRMSSGRPNLQNIPQSDLRVRYLIRAGDGKLLVGADLDSVELRLLAAYAPGGALAAAFAEGADVHQQTADGVGVSRDLGKTLSYVVLYGAGQPRVSKLLDCSPEEAVHVLDRCTGPIQRWHI